MPDPTPARPVPELAGLPLFADPLDTPRAQSSTDRAFAAVAAAGSSAGSAGHLQPPLGAPGPAAAFGLPAADPAEVAAASNRDGPENGAGIDWGLVRAFRQQAADQLATALRDREGLTDEARRELGRAIVLDLLTAHANAALTAGTPTFTADEQQALAGAVHNALFGLGRLQPLVDDPDVENIEINGCDNVHLVYSDGRIETGPPVADTDEELLDFLAFLASRAGSSERAFSPAHPRLHLNLTGDARLAASAWNTPRPLAVIRRHRLVDVDLHDLVNRELMDPGLASFLAAAVRAKRSLVISGPQGYGKTTLLRGLANHIPRLERIGTVETEYELYLHEMRDRHHRVAAWEARPGSGERGPDGKTVGEITLDDVVYDSLRFNLSRLIVGEVRGREVLPMFKAMQAGAGSLSTTHAHSARAAIQRLVTCAMEAGAHVTEGFAYRQIAEHIDLIVQIELEDTTTDTTGAGGRRRRYISEVIAVEPGEHGQPAVTDVYRPGPDGRAVPGTMPQWLAKLAGTGFDLANFTTGRVA